MEARVRTQLSPHERCHASYITRTSDGCTRTCTCFWVLTVRREMEDSQSIIYIISNDNAKYLCDLRHGSSNGWFVFPRVWTWWSIVAGIIRRRREYKQGEPPPGFNLSTGDVTHFPFVFLRKFQPPSPSTIDTFPTIVIAIHRQFECFAQVHIIVENIECRSSENGWANTGSANRGS